MLRRRGIALGLHGKWRWIWRGVALAMAGGGGGLLYFLFWAPLPGAIAGQGALTTRYYDRRGELVAELAGMEARSHRPVSLGEMGAWVPKMTLALEDRRFHSHSGVDFVASARAIVRQYGGGSTITQQYVKIATGRKGRGLFVKLREALRAVQLERRWTKEEILEAYLNRIPYGNRLIGIEAAAQAYFQKPASALTKGEAIYLVGIPRAPSRLNPWSRPEAAASAFERTLKRLAEANVLETYEEIPLPAVGRMLPRNKAPHFIQALVKSRPKEDPRSFGGVVRCTIDLEVQQRAEQLVREHIAALQRGDISQAAMVVLENETGAVRALVGSKDFAESQINGAVLFRNCGSTLKPFLYAMGIDQRVFTAATILPDTSDAVRDVYGDYDPHNFVLNHLGPVRVREALGNSLNVPAVVAVSKIGARRAFDAIGDWGIQYDRPMEKAGAGFILGNVGVKLLDLTSAFAGLARGGVVSAPRFVEKEPQPNRRIISREAAEIVIDILCDNEARFYGFGPRSPLAFPVRVAAKTGTSAAFRDTWTVGFTSEHTVGVWVGNFDGRSMQQAASVAAAAPLWRRMMDELLRNDRPLPLPEKSRITICARTGLLPSAASPGTVDEIFLPGTEPQDSSEMFFSAEGKLLLTEEYAGWCASKDNHLGAALLPSAENLSVTFPKEGAVFYLDDDLPLHQQELEIKANGKGPIRWKINGAPLPARPDGRVLWPLALGEWVLEADDGSHRVMRRFEVRR